MAVSDPTMELMRQAEEAFNRDDFLEASDRYKEAVAQKPNWPEAYHKLGRAYAARGRHLQALEAFKQAVELGLKTATIHYELALSYRQREEYELALAHAEQALQLDPEQAQYYNLSGQLRSDIKEYAKAIDYYRQAVKKDSKLTEAYLHLTAALETLERREEALEELLKVLSIDTAQMDWEWLGRLLPQGDPAEITAIANALPNEPAVWANWSQALLRIGMRDLGCEGLIRALELVGQILLELAGQIKDRLAAEAGNSGTESDERRERLGEAVNALDAALEEADASLKDVPREPFDEKIAAALTRFVYPPLSAKWAGCLARNQKLDTALTLTVNALRLWHQPIGAREFLSWIEADLPEQFSKGLSLHIEALNNEGAELAWAEVLLNRLERYAEAEHFLRRALERNADLPYAHGQLAVACAKQYKYDEAYAALTRALELYAKQSDVADTIELDDLVGALSRNQLERLQRIDELISQINQDAWYVKWASVLVKLGEQDRALVQLQAVGEREYEITDDLLNSVLFGKSEAREEASYSLAHQWADFLQKRADRNGLLQLARVFQEHDKQRGVKYAWQAVEALTSDDALWWEAGSVFKTLDAPAAALSCYQRYLGEGDGKYSVYAGDYKDWAEVLVSIDTMEKETGHIAVLVEAIENWTEDAEFSDEVPEIPWDKLKERQAAQAAHINELVEVVQQNIDKAGFCFKVAVILYNHGEYGATIQILQHAAELDHRDANTAQLMGWALTQSNRLGEARSEFQRALDQQEDWWTYLGMAIVTSRLNDIEEASKCYARAAELVDDDTNRSVVYQNWSRSLINAGKLADASEQAKRARAAGDKMWSNLYLGLICDEMRRYEEALRHYADSGKLEPHPYPQHNIAANYQYRGCYETALKQWQQTRIAYHKRLAQAIKERDAEYLFNYANVNAWTLGNRSVGEMLYRIGLELDPTHTGMLANLGSLYKEKKRAKPAEARRHFRWLAKLDWGKAEEFKQERQAQDAEARWLARLNWDKAEAILKERQARDADLEVLIELGNLYLEMDDDERARESFSQALEIRNKDNRVHGGLGEAYKRASRYLDAIRHLKQALSEAPDDLDLQTKLARVYKIDGQHDAAEAVFRNVLDMSEDHFDARVGLGEVYIAMAEECKGAKEMTASADYWMRAEEQLKGALKTAASSKRPKEISNQELAPVHYLLGYCQWNWYETAPRLKLRQRGLLQEAQRAFENCWQLDPTHYKAERARDKLREKTRLVSPDQLAQLFGPIVVTLIAFLLLIGAQAARFRGFEELGRSEFRLTEAILAAMPPSAQGPEAVFKELVSKLKPSLGKSFVDKGSLLAHVTELAGPECVGQYGETLAKYAFVPAASKHWYLSEGNWVLLSLSAVLLLIAGLYLPYLTSLTVGPLHLEKSTAEQVGADGTLGITVERMDMKTSPRR